MFNAIIAPSHGSHISRTWDLTFVNGGRTWTRSMPTLRAALEHATAQSADKIFVRHNWLKRGQKGCAGWHRIG